jgi:hypothetical protein
VVVTNVRPVGFRMLCWRPTVAELFGDTLNRVDSSWFTDISKMNGKARPMRRLRKIISFVSIAAMAVVPVLSVGCSDQSGGATSPGKTVTTTTKTETTSDSGKKIKKEKKAKKTTSTPEGGSTTGAGTPVPVKP